MTLTELDSKGLLVIDYYIMKCKGLYMRMLLVSIMILGLNGCVRPTQESYGVSITSDRETVTNCKHLGFVKASDHLLTGVLKGVAASHVDTSIRNQAGRIGADTVLMTAEHTSFWTGSAMKGEAYKCKLQKDGASVN